MVRVPEEDKSTTSSVLFISSFPRAEIATPPWEVRLKSFVDVRDILPLVLIPTSPSVSIEMVPSGEIVSVNLSEDVIDSVPSFAIDIELSFLSSPEDSGFVCVISNSPES